MLLLGLQGPSPVGQLQTREPTLGVPLQIGFPQDSPICCQEIPGVCLCKQRTQAGVILCTLGMHPQGNPWDNIGLLKPQEHSHHNPDISTTKSSTHLYYLLLQRQFGVSVVQQRQRLLFASDLGHHKHFLWQHKGDVCFQPKRHMGSLQGVSLKHC